MPRLVSASNLQLAEAGQRQVEAEALQFAEFEAEQFVVPAGVQRQLVVGNDVGPLLRLAQSGKLDHRHRRHAELPRRQQPAVAGNDAVVAVDQDRVRPAELADRGGDLRHLRIASASGRSWRTGSEPRQDGTPPRECDRPTGRDYASPQSPQVSAPRKKYRNHRDLAA